jgi:PAS domain S-box-containing protein
LNVAKKYPEVLGYGFIQHVERKDAGDFLNKTRADGAPGFNIHPDTAFDDLFVIKFIAPLERNRPAVGLDIAFEPVRRNAALASIRTGRKALTGPIQLVQDQQDYTGLLLLKPVFSNKNPIEDTEAARHDALLGWTYSPIIAGNLLRYSMGRNASEIGLQICDVTEQPEVPLFKDVPESRFQSNAAEPFHSTRDIDFHGRTWRLKFVALPPFLAASTDHAPNIVLISGLFFSFLLAWLLMNIASTRQKAIDLASAITSDLQAKEAELRAAVRFKQTLFDATDYAIISTTTGGVVTAFNRGAEQMLGYAASEIVGRQTPAIWHDKDEVLRRAVALTRELGRRVVPGFEVFVAKLARSAKDENEWTFIRKDGSRLPVLLTVTALQDDTGKTTGFLGVVADISERKKVDRLQSEFISTVSHELRTPLTSIRGSLGLVAGGMAGELSAETKELVDIASNNCDRLVRLINDILDMEKMQSGRLEFRLQAVSLARAVCQAQTANNAFAAAHHARLVLQGEPANGDVLVDADRLMQVLTNLISNAAKFSPPGADVELSVVPVGEKFLRVNIRDHGAGISDEFKGRIFQRFSQADSSDTRQKGGTGLGLSISKAIIEQLGGRIGFEPAEGGGTCFYFELPRVMPVDTNEPPGREGRVLVCEDDPDTVSVLGKMLAGARLTAHVAPSIARARELLAQFHYRAVTLDLALADGDGSVLIGEIHSSATHAHTPIIVLTGMDDLTRNHLGDDAVSVADILVKPVSDSRLLNAIRSATTRVASRHPRLLHIEDDADLCLIVKKHLPGNWEVLQAGSLASAHKLLAQSAFDVVLLDLTLPDGGGETLLDAMGLAQVIIFSASETPANLARLVTISLTKSHTDVEELCKTILALVPKNNTGGVCQGQRPASSQPGATPQV